MYTMEEMIDGHLSAIIALTDDQSRDVVPIMADIRREAEREIEVLLRGDRQGPQDPRRCRRLGRGAYRSRGRRRQDDGRQRQQCSGEFLHDPPNSPSDELPRGNHRVSGINQPRLRLRSCLWLKRP